MVDINRKDLSMAIAQLMPRIIQGVQLDFLLNRNITQTQFLVLAAIHSAGRSSMNTLANNMHVSMPTMTGIVDRLVQAGYVRRLHDSHDRRQVVVELTRKGEVVIEQFQATVSQRWQEVLEPLNSKERDSFRSIINKLNEGLKIAKEDVLSK